MARCIARSGHRRELTGGRRPFVRVPHPQQHRLPERVPEELHPYRHPGAVVADRHGQRGHPGDVGGGGEPYVRVGDALDRAVGPGHCLPVGGYGGRRDRRGGDHVDPKFIEHWYAAKRANIPRGAYHFMYWCRPAEEQARWFRANVPQDPDALPTVATSTAGFMVGAIEESLALQIGAGRAADARRLLPDLSHLVVLNYFGEDEAWLELRSEGSSAPAG